ncbi:hypothetical protein KSD_41930 [Ktedonobacter sp. SOSP1-85]|uniref:PAS domain S-box protein n=1 Tax=Ktedonobacter sp. SOSP1-85 TaxID=2778367 RepID=UPI001916BEF6|nr:PAS domain S-box protein [Ktedonobacter sp. SOSP1-85]GHO76422.1 hypothetical protein KSD_41930 [Ktedonobacter sp. SOSP1-85]
MLNTPQTKRHTLASSVTLLTILETLPGALFVLDDASTILYANTSALALTGVAAETLVGNSFWRCAPQLVSPSLYQAIQKTKQTRALTEVQYVSPATQSWLHVQLSPTVGGLLLQFHEKREPLPRRETCFPNEHLAADVLENIYSGVGVLTPEGIVLDINKVPLEDAQIRREGVIGKPLAEAPWWSFYPASQHQLRAAIRRASKGETVRFETVVRPREGRVLHLEATITPHRGVDSHVEYLVYVETDITARKRAEAELRALIETIPQMVWTRRPNGSIDPCNQRRRDYTGQSSEEAQGEGWLQCLHPEDRQRVRSEWQRAVQTGEGYEVEYRLRNGRTGAFRWFLARALPVRDEAGQILKWVGTCTDIDEQKRAEQQLKESRESLRVLAEAVPQLVWVKQPDGQFEYVNQRWCDYSGLTLEHVQSDRWAYLQCIHPDDRESNRALVQHALETGETYEYEGRVRQAQTGKYRWLLVRALPVRDETGQIVKWFGTSTDIDEQKRTEEALRQSQECIHALIDSNIIGIVSVDLEGKVIVEANDAWLRMSGYTREEVRSRILTAARLRVPEAAPLFERARQEIAACGQYMPFETELVCKDGCRLPVLLGGVLFQEQPHQIVTFVLDNSARKELEQRKDDFITMAGHELRNPLCAVKMQTQLLSKRFEKQAQYEAVTALSKVEGPIKQLERLIGELLDVSKIQAGSLEYQQERVDLDALLREIADMFQPIYPSHRILVDGAVHTSLIGDRDRLGQVFTNLLCNAIKYSPGAETVEMDLSASEEAVTIRVRDHGLGIPREQRDKIFERFYRVAGPRQKAIPGLGMGLYIVAEIVKHHGGTITVNSEVGKGSIFTVTLPTRRDA